MPLQNNSEYEKIYCNPSDSDIKSLNLSANNFVSFYHNLILSCNIKRGFAIFSHYSLVAPGLNQKFCKRGSFLVSNSMHQRCQPMKINEIQIRPAFDEQLCHFKRIVPDCINKRCCQMITASFIQVRAFLNECPGFFNVIVYDGFPKRTRLSHKTYFKPCGLF